MKKIEYYGTLGPSCCKEDCIRKMLENGMTGMRLNLSHKSLRESSEWIRNFHTACEKTEKKADLLIDLMGPEIRIGVLSEEKELKEGEDTFFGEGGIPVSEHVRIQLSEGQKVLLDDGKIELEIVEKKEDRTVCRVIRGGILRSRKSLAVPGAAIHTPALTKEDLLNLSHAEEYGVTAVMLPFVRSAEDLLNLKRILKENGTEKIRIYAKIENEEGVEKLRELIPECDCIVIARGDLGNAVSLLKLPAVQQKIASICREQGASFMVVTELLASMAERPVPTRAEVNDIFHAVTDGADALMLTGETAAGKYPVEAMKLLVDMGEEACSQRKRAEF